MMKVNSHETRVILNSLGKKSVQTTVSTDRGVFKSSLPRGTSAGSNEVDLKSPSESVKLINSIEVPEISNFQDILSFEKQIEEKKAISLPLIFSLVKALSREKGTQPYNLISNDGEISFPLLLNKVVGGGLHSKNEGPTFQEFLICVKGEDLRDNIEESYQLHRAIGGEPEFRGTDIEGGWTTHLSDQKVLDVLKKLVKDRDHVDVGLDIAANSFYEKTEEGEAYNYTNRSIDRKAQLKYVETLIDSYSISYVEDPLFEEDFEGFSKLTNSSALICGDDLLTTNPERLREHLESVDAAIVKPNQIGYLYKIKKFVDLANKNDVKLVFSHRSQETNDSILSDLAVGFSADYFKIGLVGGERVSKLNRLLEIFSS